ncbi:MAG: riboflavin kinase, partial [Planctomycetota bacterium]
MISIIALLIGILLPALGAARKTARSLVCSSNARSIALANTIYAVDNADFYSSPVNVGTRFLSQVIVPGEGIRSGGEALEGKRLPVVTNVGYRPTFRDGRDLVAEAHVIDFEGDLYGVEIDLSFEGRLRA